MSALPKVGDNATVFPLVVAVAKALLARELGLLDDTPDNINSHDGGER
jgi:hypothetical protein